VQLAKANSMDISSKRKLQRRLWLKTFIGAVTGVLSVVTPIWPDWIEAVSGWDPDQHDGSAEWMIVTVLLIVTVTMLAMVAREWQQLKVAEAS
jgi:polyferredoxin